MPQETDRCPACGNPVGSADATCSRCGSDPRWTPTADEATGIPDPQRPGAPGFDLPTGYLFAKRYTIIERAGKGGMGMVYKAIDNTLNEPVALKLIRPDRSTSAPYLERLKREVRLTRSVTHPNVCRVHDLGESQGLLYISME